MWQLDRAKENGLVTMKGQLIIQIGIFSCDIKKTFQRGGYRWRIDHASRVSRFYDIAAGDLIISGTPAGVGPINRGDVMEGEIEDIGTLKVTVV